MEDTQQNIINENIQPTNTLNSYRKQLFLTKIICSLTILILTIILFIIPLGKINDFCLPSLLDYLKCNIINKETNALTHLFGIEIFANLNIFLLILLVYLVLSFFNNIMFLLLTLIHRCKDYDKFKSDYLRKKVVFARTNAFANFITLFADFAIFGISLRYNIINNLGINNYLYFIIFLFLQLIAIFLKVVENIFFLKEISNNKSDEYKKTKKKLKNNIIVAFLFNFIFVNAFCSIMFPIITQKVLESNLDLNLSYLSSTYITIDSTSTINIKYGYNYTKEDFNNFTNNFSDSFFYGRTNDTTTLCLYDDTYNFYQDLIKGLNKKKEKLVSESMLNLSNLKSQLEEIENIEKQINGLKQQLSKIGYNYFIVTFKAYRINNDVQIKTEKITYCYFIE